MRTIRATVLSLFPFGMKMRSAILSTSIPTDTLPRRYAILQAARCRCLMSPVSYIEKIMYELGPDYSIRMVTDDKLLQFSAVHSGISRMTTKEFLENLTRIGNEITDFVRKLSESKN